MELGEFLIPIRCAPGQLAVVRWNFLGKRPQLQMSVVTSSSNRSFFCAGLRVNSNLACVACEVMCMCDSNIQR